MFSLIYPCKFIKFNHVNDGVHIKTHVHTFKARNNQRYIIEFDEFIGNIFLVKFYQKNHSSSIHKYNIMTCSGWSCSVIYTVFDLMLKTWRNNSFGNVSFAFMGSNTINADGTQESKKNTKRFNFYKILIANFVGDRNFSFKQNIESSIFVMLNKRNATVETQMNTILKYIYTHYSILDIDLILEPITLGSQSG